MDCGLNWAKHWDSLDNSTLYTMPAIKDGLANNPWPSEATTLFIKRTEENKFEKSWIGKAKNFRHDPNKGKPGIRFEVSDLQEIECPQAYKEYSNGWHSNNSNIASSIETKHPNNNLRLQPGFFAEMAVCNWPIFEKCCFCLLRLIGIHDMHKFPQSDNRGKADGFFKFITQSAALSVLYDATLGTDFYAQKETQIDNYINQLKGEKIRIGSQSYSIKETTRQVWIITRGNGVHTIRTEDNIKVKEIPYTKLIEVYNQRLVSEIGIEDLWNILRDLN